LATIRPTDLPTVLNFTGVVLHDDDYSRFLALWMDGGTRDGQRLLSQHAVRRALSPAWRIDEYQTGFENLALTYGQQ
jgi:hypothetical protein